MQSGQNFADTLHLNLVHLVLLIMMKMHKVIEQQLQHGKWGCNDKIWILQLSFLFWNNRNVGGSMSNFNWCHGPKCHTKHTVDRVRGVKGSKVLRTRKIKQTQWNANNEFSHFCSQGCGTILPMHIGKNSLDYILGPRLLKHRSRTLKKSVINMGGLIGK